MTDKEPAQKFRQPPVNGGAIVLPVKGFLRQHGQLFPVKAEAHKVIEEKVMQFIGADLLLRFLGDLAIGVRRQQLWRHRRVQHIPQDLFRAAT